MSGAKRFEASERKKRKAREDGDVAKSQLFQGAGILAISGVVIAGNIINYNSLGALAAHSFGPPGDFSTKSMLVYLATAGDVLGGVLGPFFLSVVAVALIVGTAQSGVRFSWKSLAFDWSRLHPGKNLRRVFGAPGENQDGIIFAGVLREIAKMLFVSLALGVASGLIVFNVLPSLLSAEFVEPQQFRPILNRIGGELWFSLVGILFFAGGIELVFSHQQRRKRLMMDAEEMKREFKESEGSPELRQARKQLYREIVMHGIVQGVRRAKVLVVSRLSR